MGTTTDEMALILDSITWTMNDGQTIKASKMTTGHVFNSMKMLYNHIAEVIGLREIWHFHKYSGFQKMADEAPRWMIKHMIIFIHIIELRQDLPQQYRKPYQQIICSILDALNVPDDEKMVPEMFRLLPEKATCE